MTLPGLVAANNLNDVADQEKAWDNLGSNVSAIIPISAPFLDLNFANNKSLIDDVSGQNLITFSRASTGTFIGSNGLLQTAASGVPRFDYDSETGESLGLLIEESRTNYIQNSTDFNAGDWSFSSAGTSPGIPVCTTNFAAAPDSTNTATRLVCDHGGGATSGDLSYLRCNRDSSTQAVVSIWIKSNTGSDQTIFMTSLVQPVIATNTWKRWYALSNDFRIGARGDRSDQNIDILIWGAQVEDGSQTDGFHTSYIPTAGQSGGVARATDVCTITGENFSSWYNQSEGTMQVTFNVMNNSLNNEQFLAAASSTSTTTDGYVYRASTLYSVRPSGGNNWSSTGSWLTTGIVPGDNNFAFGYSPGSNATVRDGVIRETNAETVLVEQSSTTLYMLNQISGHISRLTYWPSRLADAALQHFTLASTSSFSSYPLSFTTKGKDILALIAVRNVSVRDFIFIKGLLSPAQPRLTVAAQNTTSGTVLRDYAMPKLSPTTAGNYFFSSSFELSGTTLRVNGTNALSIATSPFSGSTATAPLLLEELRPQSNWRITEPMPSGALASPEFAIPYETNDFVLFMKAGQN